MFKKNIFVLIIFIFSIFILNGAEVGNKTRIAILPFSNRGNIDKALLEFLSEKFTNKITDIGKYNVVEREQIDKVLDELKFQKRDIFDDTSAIEIGKFAGAQIVIIGTVTKFDNDYYLSVRGIDLKTNIVIFGKEEEANNREGLIIAVDQLAISISGENITNKNNKDEFKDKIKRKNDKFINRFNAREKNFIDKYYNGLWFFSLDDDRQSFRKYQQFISSGITLTVTGSTIFLAGMISMIAMFNYYTTTIYHEWEDGVRYIVTKDTYPAYNLAPIFGGTLMPVGIILSIFSAIPFWFAYMIDTLYKKTTGRKLAFFDIINLNVGFVMGNNIFDKYENRLNVFITIKL